MLTPPNNQDAEKAVIGSIMLTPSVFQVCRQFLEPNFFYVISNGEIFRTMASMYEARQPIDIVSLADRLRQDGKFDGIGGIEHLKECLHGAINPSPEYAEYYAKIVARLYYEREIINSCRELAVKQDDRYLADITKLVNLKESLGAPALFRYEHDLVDFLDRTMAKDAHPGYPTNIPSIDAAWPKVAPGEINTWCAATNTGKSIMLLNLMNYAASKKVRCLYVGTEMSAFETVQRHMSIVTEIEPWKFRSAHLDKREIQTIYNVLSENMSKMPVCILDIPEPSLADLEAAIGAFKPEIVFLDYLERFRFPHEDSLRLKIKEFMVRLKTLARAKNVVIHLAAQLNRGAYAKEESKPTMAEISESSAIEKESDRVVLMWTPKVKAFDIPGKTKIEVILAKNRHGHRGATFSLLLDHKTLQMQEDLS